MSVNEIATESAVRIAAGRPQLFLDDGLIDSLHNVSRTLHRAAKEPANPLLVPDQPWEWEEILLFGSVIHEPDGRWRMWYMSHHHNGVETPCSRNRIHSVSYAESDDGVTWRKPMLDLLPFDGQPSNRVFSVELDPEFREFHGVVRDDADPDPAQRYKTICHSINMNRDGCVGGEGRRYFSACSPDGLRWSRMRPIPHARPINPDIAQFCYDPVEKRYCLWARSQAASDAVRARVKTPWFGRAVSLMTSSDFETWEDHGVVIQPDLDDPAGMDIYSMAAFRYGDTFVGMVQAYYQTPEDHGLDIQLACSRDGVNWTRLMDRQPVLAMGDIGEWDRFNQSIATEPVIVGDEMRLYYGGRTYRHGGSQGYRGPDSGPRLGAIGMARMRRDGFVSLDASFDGGEVVTKPLTLEGETLLVNVKSDYGELLVEALDLNGGTVAQSHPLRVDSVAEVVSWQTAPDHVLQEPVRLRFTLRNACLYAFRVE